MDYGKPEPAPEPPLASLLVYDPATWRGSTPREYLAEYFRSQQVRVLSSSSSSTPRDYLAEYFRSQQVGVLGRPFGGVSLAGGPV